MKWLPEAEEDLKDLSDGFFDDIINHIDFPLEDTNGEGDWDTRFQDLPMFMFSTLPSDFTSSLTHQNIVPIQKQSEVLSGVNCNLHQSSDSKVSKLFQSSSPVSVLETSNVSFTSKNSKSQRLAFPVKGIRSKRKRPTTLRFRFLFPIEPSKSEYESYYASSDEEEHAKKKRKIHLTLCNEIVRKCTHCETTKTPQWREGPNGPKTLCNACGVRFRSGRLVPEYRPALSPTFIPYVHSNSHRKIIEMRRGGW